MSYNKQSLILMEVKNNMYEAPELSPYFSYGSVVSYDFLGNISKDKGKYRFRYQLVFENGMILKKQQSGFKTIKEANLEKDQLVHSLLSKNYCPFDFTIKDFMEYWVFKVIIEEEKLSFNTQQYYCSAIYRHILPVLGENKKLSAITPEQLLKVLETCKTIPLQKKILRTLRSSFQYAFKKGYIKTKPAEMAAVIFLKSHNLTEQKRDVEWSVETIKMVLKQCRENFSEIYLPVVFSLMLGTRISETLIIKYQDVDFLSKTVHISRQFGYEWNTETMKASKGEIKPKTQSGDRYIPLPNWVMEEIILKRDWYEKARSTVPDFQDLDYICCRQDGTPYHRSYWRRDFQKLMCMCGLSAHWHDMRHVYATMLKNNNLNVKAISKFLGHATPEFTEKVYITQKKVCYDCTILEKYWLRMKKTHVKQSPVLEIPFVRFAQDYFLQDGNLSKNKK